MNLSNKVVVITGGAGLLGKAFCREVCERGGIAVVADINIEDARIVSASLPMSFPVEMDITNKDSISATIDVVAKQYGRIDALVNNAYPRNKQYGRSFFEVEYKDFCENLGMNLGGYFLASQLFAKYFVEQNSGNIINISSIYGVCAPKFEIYSGTKITMPVEYAAIKAGLIHLTKYMAKFCKGNNIRVNSVSPGGIFDHQPDEFVRKYTEQCSRKGMLDPKDIAGAVAFLLSDESMFMNGQNLIVDDGFTL